MTDEQAASGKQPSGADIESAPAEPEVVDAEVVDAEVVGDPDVVDDSQEPGDDAQPVDDDALSVALRERAEYLDLAQRARADFENYKRRVSAQAADGERRGRTSLAQRLLPALDNLERALTAAGVDPEGSPSPAGEPPSEEVSARDALAEGVALVYRELRAGLQRAGVNGFDPIGERFDPLQHEAIATGEAEGVDPGTILETLEQGYRIDEQVIRPARVVVSG